MSETRPRILLLAACLLLLVQALPYFGYRWVEDESWYSVTGYHYMRAGELTNPTFPRTDWDSIVDMRPPLMPLSMAAIFRLAGVSVFAARLGELLAALATLPVVYAIAKAFGMPNAGGLAALLLACDNFFFLAARTARPEAWVTLASAVAVLLLVRSGRNRSAGLAFAAGVAVGVACEYHPAAAGCAAGMMLLLLYQERGGFLRSGRVYALAGGAILGLMPFMVWAASSQDHTQAFLAMYTRGEQLTLAQKLSMEWTVRVRDLMGISNQRLHLPLPIPLRIHIVASIVMAFVVLLRRQRTCFWTLAILIVPQLLWWLYLVNKTSRYFADIAPLLSVAVAMAIVTLWRNGTWSRITAGILLLCGLSQVMGNALVLWQSRTANYLALSDKLRAAIPPGKTVYGAITFAMIFNNQPYEADDRTKFDFALREERPDYVISGDRVMMRGSGYGNDDLASVRNAVLPYVERNATLVTEIDDPFYGDLKVWRIPAAGN
jgi:4-amino-4-deoxy-L-arabinose transferase-like glycosyltransferase